MKIQKVTDPAFRKYGQVLEGYDFTGLIKEMKHTPVPEDVIYVPSVEELEALDIMKDLQNKGYGGLPIQIGYCNGNNTKLNCFEYHRGSEINIPADDMVLLLAPLQSVKNGKLNTNTVEAFSVPKGTVVQIYETTLHYAPCNGYRNGDVLKDGFRVIIVLPKGTNLAKPEIKVIDQEDRLLWAANKWLIAHPDTNEAKAGAFAGLVGVNPDIASK